MKSDDNDSGSSCFSLAITQSGCHSDVPEWILDTGSTYHVYLRRELFASFEELDGSLISIGENYTRPLVGKVQFISRCMRGQLES